MTSIVLQGIRYRVMILPVFVVYSSYALAHGIRIIKGIRENRSLKWGTAFSLMVAMFLIVNSLYHAGVLPLGRLLGMSWRF